MHGTGTPLGDPIEVGAAVAVLQGRIAPIVLTAAKSRVGHAEAGAGAIGMFQVPVHWHICRSVCPVVDPPCPCKSVLDKCLCMGILNRPY
jgi:Beta-ketoacyl synthase, C-terminal domain